MPARSAKTAKAKSSGKPKSAAPKAASRKAAPKEKEPAAPVVRSSAELHFTETTILRGDAVPAGEELPSGATHEIAGQDDCGQPVLKRKRFSLF
jgi:hypothetical protein